MKVKDLVKLLSGFNQEAPVYLMTLDGGGYCFEARECVSNRRCNEQYVELSIVDVPEEWLGDAIDKTNICSS